MGFLLLSDWLVASTLERHTCDIFVRPSAVKNAFQHQLKMVAFIARMHSASFFLGIKNEILGVELPRVIINDPIRGWVWDKGGGLTKIWHVRHLARKPHLADFQLVISHPILDQPVGNFLGSKLKNILLANFWADELDRFLKFYEILCKIGS